MEGFLFSVGIIDTELVGPWKVDGDIKMTFSAYIEFLKTNVQTLEFK